MAVRMNDHPQPDGRNVAVEILAAVDDAVRRLRHAGAHYIDQVQFAIFRLRVRVDPSTREWVDDINARLDRGEVIVGSTSYEDFEKRAEQERLKAL